MTGPKHLSSLFKNLYEGVPWIDVNIVDTLKDVSAQQAHKRVLTNCNTIWEITNHLIHWRMNVLQRVQGKIMITPVNNYIEEIEANTDEA